MLLRQIVRQELRCEVEEHESCATAGGEGEVGGNLLSELVTCSIRLSATHETRHIVSVRRKPRDDRTTVGGRHLDPELC